MSWIDKNGYRITDHDRFDNRLIFGDNLLALKALEQEFTGKIKCIYIDPPYNTGNDFVYADRYRDSRRDYRALTGTNQPSAAGSAAGSLPPPSAMSRPGSPASACRPVRCWWC